MLRDPEMEATCKGLRELGCKLAGMADIEKEHIQLALQQRGLRTEFEEA
jgi:hypothetical protein